MCWVKNDFRPRARRKHRVAHHKTAASVPLKSVCARAQAELHTTRVYKLLCIADAHSGGDTQHRAAAAQSAK